MIKKSNPHKNKKIANKRFLAAQTFLNMQNVVNGVLLYTEDFFSKHKPQDGYYVCTHYLSQNCLEFSFSWITKHCVDFNPVAWSKAIGRLEASKACKNPLFVNNPNIEQQNSFDL
jgi:hypothetical protein